MGCAVRASSGSPTVLLPYHLPTHMPYKLILPAIPSNSIGTERDANAVRQVSNPVSNTITHCSLPISQIRRVLLLPPATRQPDDCTQLSTIPGPLAFSATSGSATKADARDAPTEGISEELGWRRQDQVEGFWLPGLMRDDSACFERVCYEKECHIGDYRTANQTASQSF